MSGINDNQLVCNKADNIPICSIGNKQAKTSYFGNTVSLFSEVRPLAPKSNRTPPPNP